MQISFVLVEQLRHMECYKWIRSEESGYDIGETALLDWVDRYAASFRDWVDSMPSDCVGCGACVTGETGMECPNPFNQRRKKLLADMSDDVIKF